MARIDINLIYSIALPFVTELSFQKVIGNEIVPVKFSQDSRALRTDKFKISEISDLNITPGLQNSLHPITVAR